jgi:hypothetical protein
MTAAVVDAPLGEEDVEGSKGGNNAPKSPTPR